MTLDKLTEEVAKLREAVEKCTGYQVPAKLETPACLEHPMDSPFDMLAVTDVQVFPFKGGATLGHMKAMARIVLNDQFVVQGLRVMEGENGLFVGYPPDNFYKGEDYRSQSFPMTRQLREHIENCVLEKYHEVIE